MATYYIQADAVDLNATATYNTAEDGSGSAPANIAALATHNIVLSKGTQTITTNPTALSAVDIASFVVGPQFKGSFGADGTSISLLSTTGTITIESSGATVYLTSAGTNAKVVVAMNSGGQVRFTGGTWTRGDFSGGLIYMDAGIFTAAYMTGGSLRIIKSGTAITTLRVNGGTVTSLRNVTTLNLNGQNVQYISDGDAAITTANVAGDALLNLRSTASANVTTLNIDTGIVTPANARTGQVITNTNIYGPSGKARVYAQYGTRTITFTNTPTDYGRAGTISDSKGGGGTAEFSG